MPPKKSNQQQIQNLPPFRTITILPVFLMPLKRMQEVYKGLSKQLSIQKNITFQKILEILKDKGVYIQPKKDAKDMKKQEVIEKKSFLQKISQNEKLLKQIGIQTVAKNLTSIISQMIIQARRQKKDKLENKDSPPIKKQAKKQTKKDNKKQVKIQQPIIQQVKIVQKTYKMQCDGFIFLMDFPRTSQEIQLIFQHQNSIDLILILTQKINWGAKEPNYQLLNLTSKSIQQLKSQMQNQTNKRPNQLLSSTLTKQDINFIQRGKDMITLFKKLRKQSISNHWIRNVSLKSIQYQINPYKVSEYFPQFADKIFTNLGEFSYDKKEFDQWVKKTQKQPMIKPIQIKQKKQVINEEKKQQKKQNKKDGKKDPKKDKVEQKIQFIEQIREIRYQDQPQNIKSNLKQYKKISKISKPTTIKIIVNNLIEAIKQQKISKSQKKVLESTISADQINQIFNSSKSKIKQIKKQLEEPLQQSLIPMFTSNLRIPLNINISQLNESFNIRDIKCQSNISQNRIFNYIILRGFQSMMKNQLKYRSWNFMDRNYVEKYSKQQLLAVINHELTSQPRTLGINIKNQNLKLLILYHQNPPGRIIYHNQLHDWKSVPNLDYWIQFFKGNKHNLNTLKYYDLDYQMLGNLANRQKIMMPTDNSIIKQKKDIISSKEIIRHQVIKETSVFGINQKNNSCEFWAEIDNELNVQIKKKIINRIKETNQNEESQYSTIERKVLWIRSKKIFCEFSPYPVFFNFNTQSKNQEIKRSIGPKGEVIRYLKDKSIWIGYANGNTSIFKGGAWTYIKNNIEKRKNQPQKQLKSEIRLQGDYKIQIRQDQTIIVTSEDTIQIIFNDQTKILTNLKTHTKIITSKNYPIVRIRQEPHKVIDQNVIGYGSAYAYLGYQNLMQRSSDGYIFEVFAEEFNYFLYHQKVNHEDSKIENQIGLIWFRQGSVLKISNDDNLIYISNEDYKKLNGINQIQPWLQLFTTKQNRKQGVYDINIKDGYIQTIDKQGNNFKINLNKESQIKISVSFNINNLSEVQEPNFGNGYHVIEENYFLPTPHNFIDPKLFVIKQNGQGMQYFNDKQFNNYIQKIKKLGYHVNQEKFNEENTYIQITTNNKVKEQTKIQKFVPKLQLSNVILRVLNQYPSTKAKVRVQDTPKIFYRIFIKQNQSRNRQEFEKLLSNHKNKKEAQFNRRNVEYKILNREQFLAH